MTNTTDKTDKNDLITNLQTEAKRIYDEWGDDSPIEIQVGILQVMALTVIATMLHEELLHELLKETDFYKAPSKGKGKQ